jgi:pilus assembly protein CpaC
LRTSLFDQVVAGDQGHSHWISRLGRLSLVAGILAAATLSVIGRAQAQKLVQLENPKRTATVGVIIGKSQDVRTDASFADITVGDPDIADVHPLTDRTLSILGRKSGTTRVSVYAADKKPIGVFDVEVTYDTSVLAAELARRFPHSKIKVSSVNGRIMLSGTAVDAVTVDKAVTIARQFGADIINTVSVLAPQQVMLEVRFIEATREASRELGVQWNLFSRKMTANIGSRQPAVALPIPAPTSSSEIPAGEFAAGVLSGTSPFGFLIGRMIAGGLTTDVLINALEQKGMARTLAEPNLVALSGDTASFLAGGEYPIPVPGGLNGIVIEYKRYGVGLAFTPTVLSDGLINMKIEPEVSQLDTSNPIQLAGFTIPPLIVRRASTTVELRDGQSFVIGGLLQSTGQNAMHQLPWLGDVPILGALFRSAQYQKNETDLAIIVTPRLVRPARPGDVVKTPLDNTLPANDVDVFLMGQVEVEKGRTEPILVGHVLDIRKRAHVIDLPKGESHVSVNN